MHFKSNILKNQIFNLSPGKTHKHEFISKQSLTLTRKVVQSAMGSEHKTACHCSNTMTMPGTVK